MRLWLGKSGEEALLPRYNLKYNEQDIETTRESRTASGRLVEDIIAIKKLFMLNYGTLDNNSYETLKSIFSLGTRLNFKVERSNGAIDTYRVKMKPFGRQRLLIATRWYWEGISIVLEEV